MPTTTVNMHEAKTHLSKLVAKARDGESTIIALAGKPVAMLVPLESKEEKKPSRLGFMLGLGYSAPMDIKTPFKEDIDRMFYGNPDKFKKPKRG